MVSGASMVIAGTSLADRFASAFMRQWKRTDKSLVVPIDADLIAGIAGRAYVDVGDTRVCKNFAKLPI